MIVRNTAKPSDSSLFAQAKRGNRLAFNTIIERHWKNLYRVGYRVLQDDDATQDLIQDIFLRIWEKREGLEINQVKAYMERATHYEALKRLKTATLTASDEEVLASLPSLYQNADDLMSYSDKRNEILSIVEKLPKRQKEIFYMSRFEDLSNEEIANLLSLSKSTVEKQITNALKVLRVALKVTVIVLPLCSSYAIYVKTILLCSKLVI